MTDYVIKRDKKRNVKDAFFIGGMGGVFHYYLVHQPSTSSGEQGMRFVFILAIFFCYLGSGIYLANACLARSEILRLTNAGFHFSGYGLGRRVYFFPWTEVERIFHGKIEHRVKYRRITTHFISLDFVDPETIWQYAWLSNQLTRSLSTKLKKNIKMVIWIYPS